MVANPEEIDYAGGYEDFVHEVVPIGRVERSDMAWYSEVGTYFWDDENDSEARQAAEAYWAGIPFQTPANSLWEYRARTARIVRLVSQLDEANNQLVGDEERYRSAMDQDALENW
jgi:hypothetical protein